MVACLDGGTKFLAIIFLMVCAFCALGNDEKKPRAREVGLITGILPPGKYNAITDVPEVLVGQVTLIRGDDIRTGVTVILPHKGNIYQEKVPAAVYVGNGYGKLTGSTQIEELGEMETPILLTNTLNVPKVADAVIDYILSLPRNESVFSINPVVGETNDGWLNNIKKRAVSKEDVLDAIRNARSGPVEEGAVGAGTGTTCYGFKGGIGTASRVLPRSAGGYTVGVLVQTNFGGVLTINGAPVGRELGMFPFRRKVADSWRHGSCMIVVATDAPLLHRNLKRLAKRAILGLGRTGSYMSNGSGEYVIAFSTNHSVRIKNNDADYNAGTLVSNRMMSPLFLAVVEATEEAVYNSLFKAETMVGFENHKAEALPIDKVIEILKKYNALNWDKTLPSADRD
jgi:D-aminopeptidase